MNFYLVIGVSFEILLIFSVSVKLYKAIKLIESFLGLFKEIRTIVRSKATTAISKTCALMALVRKSWNLPEEERNRAPQTLRTIACEKVVQWDLILLEKCRRQENEIQELKKSVRDLKAEIRIEKIIAENELEELEEKHASLLKKLSDSESPYLAPREFLL